LHTSATLLIELGAVLVCLSVLGRMASRFGLSPIPLYLLVGLAFGEGGLLPLATSEEFISVGAEIGVVLLLFLLGLEYSAPELMGTLRGGLPAGLADFALNALPGAAAALLLGWGPVAAVALAGVTWVSSSGVVAKVLSDLGRLGNRETPVVLGVLVFEDLAMTVYLPVLTALLAGSGLLGGLGTVLIAFAAVTAVLLAALRYGWLISKLVSSPDPEALLLGVFGLTLLVAGLAQQLQISAAVGAFLVGIALSGPVVEGARALLTPLRDLFAAVFFVFFGLSTDPASIPAVAAPAIALGLLTTGTKITSGYWAARRAGIATQGSYRAGAALVARGEFSIVIAGLAVSATGQQVLAPLATAYVLVTVVAGPLAARYVEPIVRFAEPRVRRVRAAVRGRPRSADGPPPPPPPEPVDSTPAGPADAAPAAEPEPLLARRPQRRRHRD
jgi:CPA2 family monovalent cation:H+ antiporter-2